MLDIQQLPTPKPIPLAPSLPRFQAPVKHIRSRLPTQDDLPSEDHVPMETEPHRIQMELLINTLKPWLATHGGGYVNGNMFIYFSDAQLRSEDFRGPDVFVVLGASQELRKSWVVWQEHQGPDVVIELLSEKTAKQDKGKKKQIYQDQLHVPEYFWFDPWNTDDWAGFELVAGEYREIAIDAQNRLVSQQLGLALVRWQGVHQGQARTWLRWATLDGKLLPTEAELALAAQQLAAAEQVARLKEQAARQEAEQRAETERVARQTAQQQAEAERVARQAAQQQAEAERVARLQESVARQAAEAEVARLRALLGLTPE